MAYLLAVDDERDIVELISRFAEHEGHRIDTADNGKEAVRLCSENDYDLIILDIMMPEMDGFTACKEIRKQKQEFVMQGIRIDTPAHEIFVDGKKTELTAKEYELLLFLVQNKGIALTREKILNGVWGYDYYGDDRTVDWQIKLLRKCPLQRR